MKETQILATGGGVVGTMISATGTAIQTNEALQTVSLIVTIVGLIVTILTALIIPVAKWAKKSLADKRITSDELDDLDDTLKGAVEKIKKESENKKEK